MKGRFIMSLHKGINVKATDRVGDSLLKIIKLFIKSDIK